MEWLIGLIPVLIAAGIYYLYKQECMAHRQTFEELNTLQIETRNLKQQATHNRAVYLTQINLDADAIIELDTNQQVVEANEAAQTVFGTPQLPVTLTGWVKNHQLTEIAERVLNKRIEINYQFGYQEKIFKVRATAIQKDGHLFGTILVLKDVSELQRLGRARRDFVANISHDLRTPIAGIRLVAETLLNGAILDKTMAHHLTQRIVEEADNLQQINDELMDLSMIESGRMPLKLVSLNLAKRVKKEIKRLKEQAERKNIQLIIDMPKKMYVLADKGMLRRVLTNLLHNAIKFTEYDGQVTISADYYADDMVCVTVADSGIGIAPEDQKRIFERFYKSNEARTKDADDDGEPKRTGTGLGLAIVKHIVEAHGGQVWVESTLEKGSTFYLTLPMEETSSDDDDDE